jgi:hypothetical protein
MKASSLAAARACLPLALAAAAVLPARGALGQPAAFGTAEVTAGAGHDTNMFLPVAADPAVRPPLVGGWFGRAAPRLGAALTGGGWKLELSYSLDGRHSDAAGTLVEQQLELGVTLPYWGRWQLAVTGAGGRFDASRYPEDRFLFLAGELSLRLELGPAMHASAFYRQEWRDYPNHAGTGADLLHLGELRLAYHPPAPGRVYVAVDPVRASLVDDGVVRLVRVGPDLEVVLGRISLGAWAWGGSLERQAASRLWQVGGGLGALLRLGRQLDVVATFDWTGSPGSSDAAAADYARRFAALSVVGHLTGRTSLVRRSDPVDLAPTVRGHRVRFRVRAPGAGEVLVVGSWDDWDPNGRQLAPTGEGLYETWVELPPGQHRYRFVVDGKSVRPPDAARYAVDDFGGEDALVDVGETPAP